MATNYAIRTLGFAGAVCVVAAVAVSSSAVLLRERQETNAQLDRRRNALVATGDLAAGATASREEVERLFASYQAVAVDLRTGREDPEFELAGYDAQLAQVDPARSEAVPRNPAQVVRIPHHVVVFKKVDAQGALELLVLPIEGKGLWSTLYGYLALEKDLRTIRGLTYYEHGETPGLGGEVDNPRWKARWPGRLAFDDEGDPAIQVTRGPAGPPAEDPYRVDGLSGATITSRGVTNMLRFWLSEQGYGPYLEWLGRAG